MNLIVKLFTVLSLFILKVQCGVEISSDDPDFQASIAQLIESRGFNYEEHFIVTQDGYILGVYRLINPFLNETVRKQLKPIVLQHGFLGTGTDFLINSPGGNAVPCSLTTPTTLDNLDSTQTNNIAFLLANLCYDVWISNSRGNGYSRNHTTLNPDTDSEYWNFSIDEMILYDSPAVIDYILEETGFTNLAWIGHSQGTMLMFGLLSAQPEYSLKVKPFIALAPVCFVKNFSFALRFASHIPYGLYALRKLGGELSDKNIIMRIAENIACPSFGSVICNRILYPILGYNLAEMNTSRVDVYRGQIGSGTSLWNLVHFGQNINAGNFVKFDYGKAENEIRYNGPKPPAYELAQINSTSIALLYSKSDDLGDLKDVTLLIEALKVPLLRDYFVPLPSWNHLDFLYAKDSYEYVNSVVIEILKNNY